MAYEIVDLAENVVKLYVKKRPQIRDIEYYRGDGFSFTIIGLNGDDTPFDFSDIQEFLMNFRVGSPRNPNAIASFSSLNFVLGQTNEAIAYDSMVGNGAGATKNELHLVDASGDILSLDVRQTYYDVRMKDLAGEVHTLIKGRINIEYDVSRQ